MTIGLPDAIEEAIEHHFWIVYQNDSAIIAAITLAKFRLKWVDSQSSRHLYKQMLIQEMRLYQLHAADNEVTVVEESQAQASQTTGYKKVISMILNLTMNLHLRTVLILRLMTI